jgi:RNA polymerase sigma-70 factor (ECF subfamily)
VVYRNRHDSALAEDVAQEACVRAFDRLETYDFSYKFGSWLFKIAYNLSVDELRKKGLDTVSIDGAPDATTAEEQQATGITPVDRSERPDERLEARELGREIEEAIGELRPDYRTAIVLRHIEGRPYDEISEIMEIPLGTVKTYIHRARKELQESLAHLRSGVGA